jgi:hypothetical protein
MLSTPVKYLEVSPGGATDAGLDVIGDFDAAGMCMCLERSIGRGCPLAWARCPNDEVVCVLLVSADRCLLRVFANFVGVPAGAEALPPADFAGDGEPPGGCDWLREWWRSLSLMTASDPRGDFFDDALSDFLGWEVSASWPGDGKRVIAAHSAEVCVRDRAAVALLPGLVQELVNQLGGRVGDGLNWTSQQSGDATATWFDALTIVP